MLNIPAMCPPLSSYAALSRRGAPCPQHPLVVRASSSSLVGPGCVTLLCSTSSSWEKPSQAPRVIGISMLKGCRLLRQEQSGLHGCDFFPRTSRAF